MTHPNCPLPAGEDATGSRPPSPENPERTENPHASPAGDDAPEPPPQPAPPAAGSATPPRRPRSAAQAAASRANGARGRGPVTAAGRAASSGNAITHGLLAKRVAPLPDDRLERETYQRQLEGLTSEFRPATQTEANLVELIAAEWVQVGRLRQATEAWSRAGKLDMGTKVLPDVANAERRVAACKAAGANLRRGIRCDLPTEDLRLAVEVVIYTVVDLRDAAAYDRRRREAAAAAQAGGVDAAGGAAGAGAGYDDEPDPDAVLHDRIDPAGINASDQDTVSGMLRDGASSLASDVRERWALLLDRAAAEADSWLAVARETEIEYETCRRSQRGLDFARSLPALQQILIYDARVRRELFRTMAVLSGVQRARSRPAAEARDPADRNRARGGRGRR